MEIESLARRQLACLGDASRFRIVTELTSGEACVTELAGRIGLSQSCTTRHLQALVRAGLVTRQRAGRRVLFAVRSRDPAVRSLLDWKSRLEADGDIPTSPAGERAGSRGARRSAADRGRAGRPGGENRRRDAARPRNRHVAPSAALPAAPGPPGAGPGDTRSPAPRPGPAAGQEPDPERTQPEGREPDPVPAPDPADDTRDPRLAKPVRRGYQDLEDFLL